MFALALLALAADPAPAPKPAAAPADDGAFDMDRGNGELADDKISEVMKKNGWQIADCYTRTAFKGQSGRMMLEFEIGEDGSVVSAKRTESSLNNPALEDCVANAVKKYKFPAPIGGTVVKTWPFVF